MDRCGISCNFITLHYLSQISLLNLRSCLWVILLIAPALVPYTGMKGNLVQNRKALPDSAPGVLMALSSRVCGTWQLHTWNIQTPLSSKNFFNFFWNWRWWKSHHCTNDLFQWLHSNTNEHVPNSGNMNGHCWKPHENAKFLPLYLFAVTKIKDAEQKNI